MGASYLSPTFVKVASLALMDEHIEAKFVRLRWLCDSIQLYAYLTWIHSAIYTSNYLRRLMRTRAS